MDQPETGSTWTQWEDEGGGTRNVAAGAILASAVAAGLVWFAPNSWRFTERITPVRAAWVAALLAASVLFMWTQTENPFIYFQF